MKQNNHIAIVGGGLIGMMSAFYLLKSGFKITIYDKMDAGRESTWAGGGIISPLYPWKYPKEVNYLARYSQSVYEDVAAELQSKSGLSSEYTRSGMLLLESELETAEAVQWLKQFAATSTAVATSSPILNNINPELSYRYLPGIAQIRNPRLAKSIKIYLERSGVSFRVGEKVIDIQPKATGDIGIVTADGAEDYQHAVVCAGAWTGRLLRNTGIDLPIKPIRGQMLLFKAPPDFLKPIILARGHYAIPRRDGHILVGSTMEDVGFDKAVTEEAKSDLAEFCREFIPGLLDQPLVKQWAGLRPGSPRGIPLIAPHPEITNLTINAGHFRNGVVLAPASGRLLTDLILGKHSFVNSAYYSFENFARLEIAC